jgi:Protein of unknown function (DUF3489)
MKVFSIVNHNTILAFADQDAAAASEQTHPGNEIFRTLDGLTNIANDSTGKELVALYNGIPGVTPVAKFENRGIAAKRIWAAIQTLPLQTVTGTIKPVKGGFEITQTVDPLTGDPIEKGEQEMPKKKAPKAKATPKANTTPQGVRGGTKHAEVIALLKRAHGATIVEIMSKMGWQRHTVRGFMAGAMKKAGYNVESFKPEGGERTYRLPR